jgi:hypothetical protein
LLAALILITASAPSRAETSKELALAGHAWAAFECSGLASTAQNSSEGQRLFELGFKQGKRFIEALVKSTVTDEDVRSTVPLGFTLVIFGPSADFVLGRAWEKAFENAHKNVYKINGKFTDDAEWPTRAKLEFTKRNCEMLK